MRVGWIAREAYLFIASLYVSFANHQRPPPSFRIPHPPTTQENIVVEVENVDDLFRFQSGAYVEALVDKPVRLRGGATGGSGGGGGGRRGAPMGYVSQITRLHHLQVADVLYRHQNSLSKAYDDIFNLADHSTRETGGGLFVL